MNGLRRLGACVALDDFGAGASHFGYLKSLKVDIIKVDGQFIKGMLQDPVDDVSVRGFLEVARVLGVHRGRVCGQRGRAGALPRAGL